MLTYNEQMQRLAREYKRENRVNVIDLDKICDWALQNKKWEPDPVRVRRVFKDSLSTALRGEYETDPQGRRVRINHRIVTKDKRGKQLSLWDDIKTATRDFLQKGFQLRRRQSFADLRQLKSDADSVNDNRFRDDPILMQYDFTKELVESDLVRTKQTPPATAPKQPFGRPRDTLRPSTSSHVTSRP